MQKILVAGGTGLIGSNLITKLKQKNYEVVLLTTRKNIADDSTVFYWNPAKNEFPKDALVGITACINLCGAGIFEKRFTQKRKEELMESRVLPAQIIAKSLIANKIQLKHYISASATGYYENICSELLTENSTKGTGFISDLVEQWEHAALFNAIGATKVSIIRTGIVFSEKAGFLKQLSTPVKYFVGAPPANGNQMISWIHIDDLTEMIIYIMEKNLEGTFNAVADRPEKLKVILQQIANQLHRPLLLPNIPVFILRLLFGERYKLLMSSQKVSNEKITLTGFKFKYHTSEMAVENLLKL